MTAVDVARSLFAAWEAHDPALAERLLADDFVLTGPAPVPLDKQGFLTFQRVHNAAFGDWAFNQHLLHQEGNRVTFGIQITATHTGPYDVGPLGLPVAPIPATGKRRQWPPEQLTLTVEEGRVTTLHADVAPEGGVVGTLAWLGVQLPAPNRPSPREIAERWAQLWNAAGDLGIIDQIVAPDFVSHSAPPGLAPGSEGVRQWVQIFRNAFPDIYSYVEDVVADGDKVVERFRAGGTHRGDFFGIPPTGRHATTTGINIFRIANGKIVEHWANSDDLGILRQLGAIPG